MTFDIAIVNYNTDFFLYNLLCSIRDVLPAAALGRVHVWDNGSKDRSLAMLTAFAAQADWLHVHHARQNIYHGPALDRLLRDHCRQDWVLILDSDTEIRKNFVPALPLLQPEPGVFVGQMAPNASELYAYLFYLLLNRTWYLDLPPFRHHGAPGVDLFRHVGEHRIPYQRFRWSDYVEHFGQATLGGIYERGETDNEFFAFASTVRKIRPPSPARSDLERRLRAKLDAFLSVPSAPGEPLATQRRIDRPLTAPVAPRDGGPSAAAAVRGLLRRVPGAPIAKRALLRLLTRPTSRILQAAYAVGMTQKRSEIARLLRLVQALRPRVVVEIGTSYGGTFYLWTHVATDDAILISVDLPPWELDDPAEAEKLRLFRGFRRAAQAVHFLRADSHSAATRSEVIGLLGSASIDFLFIDGDHSYDGVRRDFDDYAPLVRAGGLIAFHDIHEHSKGWGGDVPRFWREVCRGRDTRQFIERSSQDGFGIGVIVAGSHG